MPYIIEFCLNDHSYWITAQAFGFPFLEPYSRHLQESAYRRGVNFAYSAAFAAVSNAETPFFLQRETQNYFAFIDNHTGDGYLLSLYEGLGYTNS